LAESTRTVTLPITGMTCANCVGTIERGLRKLDGVEVANVNLASERASIEFDPARLAPQALVERIRRGYDALGDASWRWRAPETAMLNGSSACRRARASSRPA
jgi:Cu+-exporting ATPase